MPATPARAIRELALTRVKPVGQQPRDRRRPGHPVGLGRDEAPERRGEQPGRVRRHRAGQDPAEEGAQRERGADGPAAALAEAVEQRADEGREQRERRHGEQQEQRHLRAGLVGRDREDRAGEADGQGGVAADVDEVQLDEPRQPALAGPRGAGEGAGPLGARPATTPGEAGAADRGPAERPEGLRRAGAHVVRVRGGLRAPGRGASPAASCARGRAGGAAHPGRLTPRGPVRPGRANRSPASGSTRPSSRGRRGSGRPAPRRARGELGAGRIGRLAQGLEDGAAHLPVGAVPGLTAPDRPVVCRPAGEQPGAAAATGQSSHRGARAVQTRAPSSMTATFHVLASSSSSGSRASARATSARVRAGRPGQAVHDARLDAADVGVDDDRAVAEREGRDGGRGVVADPGQGPQLGLVARHHPAVPLGDGGGALVQAQRPPRVAEPAPGPDHLAGRLAREVGRGRPALHPLAPDRLDPGDRVCCDITSDRSTPQGEHPGRATGAVGSGRHTSAGGCRAGRRRPTEPGARRSRGQARVRRSARGCCSRRDARAPRARGGPGPRRRPRRP